MKSVFQDLHISKKGYASKDILTNYMYRVSIPSYINMIELNECFSSSNTNNRFLTVGNKGKNTQKSLQ